MARIQSKTSGRKPPSIRLKPKELRAAAETALRKLGAPSKRWGDDRPKRPVPSGSPL